jgi:hypothetical protein
MNPNFLSPIKSGSIAITFEKAFELITDLNYLKKLDNDSNVALVPMGTYLVKNFKDEPTDKIYTTSLVDSIGVTIADRINQIVVFCHFHPINSLSRKLIEKSLSAIKKEFIAAGGNITNTKLRIIGGQDEKIRANIISGCNLVFNNCNVKIDNGFFNKVGSNQSTHAIVTARGSYIAKLDPTSESKDCDIKAENYNVIRVFPENTEALFFTQCQYIKNSDKQNLMNAKADLMIRKVRADLLKIDVTNSGSNIYYDLPTKTYKELLEKDIGNKLTLQYYYNGCGLVSVQNMMIMDKNRKVPKLVNQDGRSINRGHYRLSPKIKKVVNKTRCSRTFRIFGRDSKRQTLL